MSYLQGLYKSAFCRNYSSSCDNLSLWHAVKIRSKLCPRAKHGILVSSSHYGDCMTNNHFIIKATFPCLLISANMLLQAPSAHLEHSSQALTAGLSHESIPLLSQPSSTFCQKKSHSFWTCCNTYCILSLYWHSIHVCYVEFGYFELLSIPAVDYSD